MAKKAVRRSKPVAPDAAPVDPRSDIATHVSAVTKSIIAASHAAFKDNKLMLGTQVVNIGIPLPGFALEYLLQSNTVALGCIMQLVGSFGSMKSGFAAEMARWFIEFNGGMVHWYEHESKMSDDWLPSIVGWKQAESVMIQECHSVDDWQTLLQHNTLRHEEYWKSGEKAASGRKRKGPGYVYPVLHVVDSVMGKPKEETSANIERSGSAGRQFPLEALSLTYFLKSYADKMYGRPMMLVLVNQLKAGKTDQGFPTRNKAGGVQKEFQETYELEMRSAKTKEYAEFTQVDLEMRCYKNSLGVTDRKIPVIVKHWNEPIEGDDESEADASHTPTHQITIWDWEASSIELLLRLLATDGVKTKVREVLDLTKTANQFKAWSKALGISQKDPMTYHDAGLLLQGNVEVMRGLRQKFGIKRRPVFEPGMDFEKLAEAERRRIGKVIGIAK